VIRPFALLSRTGCGRWLLSQTKAAKAAKAKLEAGRPGSPGGGGQLEAAAPPETRLRRAAKLVVKAAKATVKGARNAKKLVRHEGSDALLCFAPLQASSSCFHHHWHKPCFGK
jgi:hypothetical protein